VKVRGVRVLITGAGGYVGEHLAAGLAADHDLRLGDLSAPANDARWVQLDVTRPAQVAAAMRGIDAVVHLAIASGHEGDYEEDSFNQLRFDVNVRGTWNVLWAAAQSEAKRFVYTSSLMVVWDYPPGQPVASDADPRPAGTYAVTKMLGEQMCEYVARRHGLSVVCLRIPKPIDPADPRWKCRPIRPQWLAFAELVRAYRLALAAQDIGFEIVTIVGESSRRRHDLSKAERVLGYRPAVRLEDLGFELGDEREPF
jgi:uronate dehydrogenase